MTTFAAKGRPISPHVSIYAFPVTAISSILIRVTGVALTGGVLGISAAAAVGADVPALIDSVQAYPAMTPMTKFVVAFPLVYHYLGGVRHLVWDHMPTLLTTKQVVPTSMGILGGATVVSLALSAYSLKREKK